MPNVVVFDLDETLGYFTEYGMFYELLVRFLKIPSKYHQEIFNYTLELYPEVFRPNILSVFNYLKNKKKTGKCEKILIYTNNQGPKTWTRMINNYIHSKINYQLFDSIIGAFKIRGKIEEVGRTTNDKNREDLVRCAKLPPDTEICFVDDVYYKSMNDVYYIKVSPYVHNISMNVMVNRFLESSISSKLGIVEGSSASEFIRFVRSKIIQYNYAYIPKTKDGYDMDKIVTKQMMILLQKFFGYE